MMDEMPISFEKSTGNIFADLELDDASDLFARAHLGLVVFQLLKKRALRQREAARLLGIAQPDVSHLMNGHFSRFTTDKMLDFLRRLEHKVVIQVSPREPGEPYRTIGFAA